LGLGASTNAIAGSGPTAPSGASPAQPQAGSAVPQGPFCTAAEYRQFDFWLGDWEVRNPDGKVVGHNRLTPTLQGCALHESWEGIDGSRGNSYSTWSSVDRLWHQFWVDNSGTLLDLAGTLEGRRMVLSGTRPSIKNPGTIVHHRISWEPLDNGTVRQLWEVSTDQGTTWKVLFDGIYARASALETRPKAP
jgi:hypothetical protein